MKVTNFDIEMWEIDRLIPYDKNAKHHTESQVEALAKVIKSQGWDVPIVVDQHGVIIKGHGRRMAAIHLGLKKVPVICRRDMTDAQVKAARLSDNRVALGDFDVDLIKDELAALQSDGFEMDSMGFDEKEISMMLGELDAMQTEVLEENQAKVDDVAAETKPEGAKPAGKQKPVPLNDLFGFKHIPHEYRDVVIKLQRLAEESTGDVGAVAFGKMAQSLVSDPSRIPVVIPS